MPNKMWNAQVDHLEGAIDRCRERIDEIVQQENSNKLKEKFRKQVYNSGTGTTVEVSVKTRKPSTRSAVENKDNSEGKHSKTNRIHKSTKELHGRSEKDDRNWDSLLSQDDNHTDNYSPTMIRQHTIDKPKIKNPIVTKRVIPQKRIKTSNLLTRRNAKVPVESKQFAQKTSSSRAKEKERNENLRKSKDQHVGYKNVLEAENEIVTRTEKESENMCTSSQNKIIRQNFPNRTLQIFLRELRSTVNANKSMSNLSANDVDLNKILDDLDFVAAHLNPYTPGAAIFSESNGIGHQNSKMLPIDTSNAQTEANSDTVAATEMIKEEVIRRLQIELEKEIKINQSLKSNLEKMRKEALLKDSAIREKDKKNEDMKLIVGRLTGTNNDMLAILSSKVRLEESLKTVETANRKLLQELEKEKRHNSDLEAMNISAKKEISQFRQIINNLRGSMNLHGKDVENIIESNLAISTRQVKDTREVNDNQWRKPPVDSTFGTVDLGLSSDHSSAVNSPLPTDSPLINLPEKEYYNHEQLQVEARMDQIEEGFLTDKDDDVDSAIGNSESHPILSAGSSNKIQHSKGVILNPNKPVPIEANLDLLPAASVPMSSLRAGQYSKLSLGEEIQILHKRSQEQKLLEDKDISNKLEAVKQPGIFQPKTLSLSETVDSQRLDTSAPSSEAKGKETTEEFVENKQGPKLQHDDYVHLPSLKVVRTKENQSLPNKSNLPPPPPYPVATDYMAAGDRHSSLTPNTNFVSSLKDGPMVNEMQQVEDLNHKKTTERDQRKSREEINLLKLQREQQHLLLLDQQRKRVEQHQKMAEENLIASQVKTSSTNVHEKVTEFLSRMKNDEKFQISLKSPVDFTTNVNLPKEPSTLQMNFTGTTNADEDGNNSASLTESKFRQGLEVSLDYSAASDNN